MCQAYTIDVRMNGYAIFMYIEKQHAYIIFVLDSVFLFRKSLPVKKNDPSLIYKTHHINRTLW